MPDVLESPLTELRTDFDRLRALLALIKSLRAFAATNVDETAGEPFAQSARGLRTEIRSLSADIPVLSGTLLLYLAGRFEYFVRTSFQALCDGFAGKCDTFGQLPPKMQESLRYFTAEVCVNPRKYGFDEHEATGFLVTFAGNMAATAGLGAINSVCLSITQSNMHPSALADLYKRVGIASLWSEVGKQAALKLHFTVPSDSEAERSAKARLEELMALRNQVAHPSGAVAFPDPDGVTTYIDFLAVLASVLTDVARVQLATFRT